eukprot:s425_g35.t1
MLDSDYLEFDSQRFTQADLFRHVTEQEFQKMGGQVHEDWKVRPVMLLEELAGELADETSGSAETWLEAFWAQVQVICHQVVDSFRESLRDGAQLGMFEILGLDFVCKADGSVSFLEANRDPSWVIDGGAKKAIIPTLVTDLLNIVLQAHGESCTSIADTLQSCTGRYKFRVLIDETCRGDDLEAIGCGREKKRPALKLLYRRSLLPTNGWMNSAFYEGEEERHVELDGSSHGSASQRGRAQQRPAQVTWPAQLGKMVATARPSSRSQGRKSVARNEGDTLEENDALRMRILRERGRSAGSTWQHNASVDDDDFEAVLRKEGVGFGADVSSRGSFVERPSFDLVIGVAIMVNAIVLGLEIDLSERTDPMVWIVAENIFCSIWIAETLIKWWYLRLSYFCDAWNWLDLLLVMLSIYDAWIAPLALSSETRMDLGFLRVVRVMRLLRLVRLCKRCSYWNGNDQMRSMRALFRGVQLMLMMRARIMRISGIVVDCGKDFSGWSDCSMMFGTMPKSMYTLFQVLTLESWSMVISRPLMEVQPILVVPIISFILLTTFGTLNIIVGVVVENTLSAAKQNLDLQNKRAEKQVIKDRIFMSCQTKEEFIEICSTASIRRALQRMGVPLDQAETLFDIIDSSRTGEVTFAGFIEGVKKVRGAPTSLDMKTMMVAVRNIYKQQVRLEKDSQNLQEAQRNGNIIRLPAKEDLENLLVEKQKLMSQQSFSSIKTAWVWLNLALVPAIAREGEMSITPVAMRETLPNAVSEDEEPDFLGAGTVQEEVLSSGSKDRASEARFVPRPTSPLSDQGGERQLRAVVKRSYSQERLSVVLRAKHLPSREEQERRTSPVRVKLTDKQLLSTA